MLSKSKNIQAEYIYHVSVFCRKWRFYRSFKSFFSHLTTNKIQPNLVENSKLSLSQKNTLDLKLAFLDFLNLDLDINQINTSNPEILT